ncbi:MAG: omega-amidase [Glaciecola sp.]|jgi:omega-amidase|uniref:amidohydrolase n=1 Tax=Congregibacter sp. TaxID=2744308 RepID=UPI0039E4DADD
MRDLRVTLVQQALVWEDAHANREHLAGVLKAADPDTDLILLPEMFTTGFSMNAQSNAEPAGGDTQDWLQSLADSFDCAIAGSVATEEGGDVYNRLLFVTPDRVDSYDKRHLFRMAGEQNYYAAGAERVVLEWRGWRIKPEVCYDLRFPVFSRNRNDYDLLFYVANWPSPRSHHWRALLQARAIENLACVVGVNRIGEDDNGLSYSGDSLAFDQEGSVLMDLSARAAVETVCFSGNELCSYRDRFPTQLDADAFVLES